MTDRWNTEHDTPVQYRQTLINSTPSQVSNHMNITQSMCYTVISQSQHYEIITASLLSPMNFSKLDVCHSDCHVANGVTCWLILNGYDIYSYIHSDMFSNKNWQSDEAVSDAWMTCSQTYVQQTCTRLTLETLQSAYSPMVVFPSWSCPRHWLKWMLCKLLSSKRQHLRIKTKLVLSL